MAPFFDVSNGVAALYCSVMYGDPGTSGSVSVEAPWKYWTVTECVSQAVALWLAKLPWCSTKPACQSFCVGWMMDVPSKWRLVLMPKLKPVPSSCDSYGNGPPATWFPAPAA